MAAVPVYWPAMITRAPGLPVVRRTMNNTARMTRSSTVVPAKAATAVAGWDAVTVHDRLLADSAHPGLVPLSGGESLSRINPHPQARPPS
jgi:hypothetical protein